jgi:hypothetical protein
MVMSLTPDDFSIEMNGFIGLYVSFPVLNLKKRGDRKREMKVN